MGLATFKGGIHTYEGKELSEINLCRYCSKRRDVFPLSQHIGAPAKPLVAAEIRYWLVRRSGRQAVLFQPCVISSVSGTVKTIEPRMVANGSMVMSIIVGE